MVQLWCAVCAAAMAVPAARLPQLIRCRAAALARAKRSSDSTVSKANLSTKHCQRMPKGCQLPNHCPSKIAAEVKFMPLTVGALFSWLEMWGHWLQRIFVRKIDKTKILSQGLLGDVDFHQLRQVAALVLAFHLSQ